MHFSTLIAAFMLPLTVLGGPIADADRAYGKFFTGFSQTIKLLDEVIITAKDVEDRQAPLINGTSMARDLVAAGAIPVHASFSSIGTPHIPPEEYVEAYS